jgi:hypothetical protein
MYVFDHQFIEQAGAVFTGENSIESQHFNCPSDGVEVVAAVELSPENHGYNGYFKAKTEQIVEIILFDIDSTRRANGVALSAIDAACRIDNGLSLPDTYGLGGAVAHAVRTGRAYVGIDL